MYGFIFRCKSGDVYKSFQRSFSIFIFVEIIKNVLSSGVLLSLIVTRAHLKNVSQILKPFYRIFDKLKSSPEGYLSKPDIKMPTSKWVPWHFPLISKVLLKSKPAQNYSSCKVIIYKHGYTGNNSGAPGASKWQTWALNKNWLSLL